SPRKTAKAAAFEEEAAAFEPDEIGFDHGAGGVSENRRVVRRRAQMTPVQSAPLVALDVDERVECVNGSVAAAIKVAVYASELVVLVASNAKGRARRGDCDVETTRPTRRDCGA